MNRIVLTTARLLFALFALLICVSPRAEAQTGLYGGFSASKVNYPTDQWVYGGTFGLYSDFYPLAPVKLGADLRFSDLRATQNTDLFSTLIGPRVAFHLKSGSVNPYAEVLVGWGHYSFGNNVPSRTRFEYQVLAGIDHPVLSHLDWRVIEFSYAGLNTHTPQVLHPETLTTGVVVRF